MKVAVSKASDAQLVNAIRASEEDAFKNLYYRYYESLFRFLCRRTRNYEISKDLMQELFIRVWRNREKLDASQSLKAYLYRIASNLAIDHLRKKEAEQAHFVDNPTSEPTASPSETFDLRDNIGQAIRKLPEPLQTVFHLSRDEGLTYSEIAATVQVSIKTVESRMSQALKILREKLKPFLVSVVLLSFFAEMYRVLQFLFVVLG